MAYDVFTDEWAKAWCENINGNESYKESAQDWEWPLILKMSAGEGTSITDDRAVYVDLKNGACVNGRAASEEDLETAPYIIAADVQTWKKIFDGDMDMMTGIMWGKVKLEKGNLGAIAQHVSAAKHLVISAMKVETSFPD